MAMNAPFSDGQIHEIKCLKAQVVSDTCTDYLCFRALNFMPPNPQWRGVGYEGLVLGHECTTCPLMLGG